MPQQAQTLSPVQPVTPQFRTADQFAQALILAALVAAPVLTSIHQPALSDPDVWWHIRTGEWILQHHALPHTDPFSSFGAGKPWEAYTWLFDILIFQCYKHLGLVGILWYVITAVSATTIAIYRLTRAFLPDFTVAILLTCAAWRTMAPLYTPRPWLFTILFFVLELHILMQARLTGKTRALLWLPPMFALWANLHIQFVDGLLVMALALAESTWGYWSTASRTRLPIRWIVPIFVLSLLATLINPYGWTIYRTAHDLAAQSGVLDRVQELHAPAFRLFSDYLLLLLALCVAFVFGWKRRLQPFEIALFGFSVIAAFRSERDLWMLVASGSAFIACGIAGAEQKRRSLPMPLAPVIALATALIVFVGVRVMHVDSSSLRSTVAKTMPLDAAEFVKAKGYPGPIFNNYDWGGFFMWYLRMPVSIDGRAALHGDDRMKRSFATWDGEPDWASDPDLQSAALVIGPIKSPLTQLLRVNGRFDLVYEDSVAAVFVSRKGQH